MADIKNEVQSIREVVGHVLPDVKYNLMHMPAEYKADTMSIEYAGGKPAESETGYHYRIDRLYQIIYLGKNALDCVEKMGKVERLFNNEMVIPLKNVEGRYLRIDSFSLSRPFKTESGVYAIIGMLSAHFREARSQSIYPKIGKVETRTYTDKIVISWAGLEGTATEFEGDEYTFEKLENGETVLGETAAPNGFTWSEIESGKIALTKEEE